VTELIVGVGLFGPVVVACGLMALEMVRAVVGTRVRYDEVDDLAGMPRGWTLAWFLGGALAAADVIVAAIGYDAPLAILVRTALAGALTGLIVGRALAIGNGAALMLVGLLWPLALAIGFAIHLGALWVLL